MSRGLGELVRWKNSRIDFDLLQSHFLLGPLSCCAMDCSISSFSYLFAIVEVG